MQTFLPYPDFTESAKSLDYRRLGKQRVEAYQILNALLKRSNGWINHPATNLWRGYEYALCSYGIAICEEWRSRGYKDTLLDKFLSDQSSLSDTGLPSLIGNEEFHRAHQSNLVRKAPDYYKWDVPNDLPYIWTSIIPYEEKDENLN